MSLILHFHERNSDFLKLQALPIFFNKSQYFSIICKNVTEASSPFSPISSLPDTWTSWHGEEDNKLCHNKHQAMNAAPPPPHLKCLDKTQIRGYSTDTAANNESYLHTPVMSDIVTLFIWNILSQIVTLGMIRDNCLVTMFDSYYPESTQWGPIMELSWLKPHQSLPLKAI